MSEDAPMKKIPGLLGAGLNSTPADLARGGLSSVLGNADFLSWRKVEGLWFNNKEIALDGYSFDRCRFDNCTLIVTSPNFDLINCLIDDSTVIKYGAEATKIIQLFNSRFLHAYNYFAPPFVPLKNPDGSITITPGR